MHLRSALFAAALVAAPLPAAAGGTLTTLATFGAGTFADTQGPARPEGSLLLRGSVLYGTTNSGGTGGCFQGCGTIYALDATTGAGTVLHSFNAAARHRIDGAAPTAGLAWHAGRFYGTTTAGGADLSGDGTTFSLGAANRKLTILHSFAGGADGRLPSGTLVEANGALYGTAVGETVAGIAYPGSVFRIDIATGAQTVVAQASYMTGPVSGLTSNAGALYGASAGNFGAGGDCGSVFKIDLATGTPTRLYSFACGTDGALPMGPPVYLNGALYGTTASGGSAALGTLYRVDATTGAETVVHDFVGGADGSVPWAGLTLAHGLLYGTTMGGGHAGGCASYQGGCGSIFRLDPATGEVTVRYGFTGGADGRGPMGPLLAYHNALYGTTTIGGVGIGTVFRFTE